MLLAILYSYIGPKFPTGSSLAGVLVNLSSLSKRLEIELNCLAFQIRRIERIELIRKVRIGIELTN
jgi:hypothetical protein